MNLKLKIFGYVLLAAYTLLLLHNLIPHYHSDEQGHIAVSHENGDHNHEHHHHDSDKADSHDHVSHSDHNTFELLVCFHEETEHTASGIDHTLYHHSETRTSFINTISGAKDFAIPVSCFNTDITKEEQADLSFAESPDYQPPLLLSQPARGPPLFS